MTPHEALRGQILQVLREQVLPWLRQGKFHLLPAILPLQSSPAIRVIPNASSLLRRVRPRRSSAMLSHWPKERLTSVRYPRLCLVLEGEADITLGVTESMAGKLPSIDRSVGQYTLQLPQRSIVVIPPGVPVADGTRPHWERPDPQAARSRILWMTAMGGGAELHLCATKGTEHRGSVSSFVRDPRLALLVDLLLEALGDPGVTSEVTAALLLVLLVRVEQGYAADHATSMRDDVPGIHLEMETVTPPPPAETVVCRACEYIDANFSAAISAQAVAAHAYVSVSHLNRLFRAELGTSIMAYVTAKRVELARQLLETTDLPVHNISLVAGYTHPNYLSYVFTRATGETPLAFRRRRAKSDR